MDLELWVFYLKKNAQEIPMTLTLLLTTFMISLLEHVSLVKNIKFKVVVV